MSDKWRVVRVGRHPESVGRDVAFTVVEEGLDQDAATRLAAAYTDATGKPHIAGHMPSQRGPHVRRGRRPQPRKPQQKKRAVDQREIEAAVIAWLRDLHNDRGGVPSLRACCRDTGMEIETRRFDELVRLIAEGKL